MIQFIIEMTHIMLGIWPNKFLPDDHRNCPTMSGERTRPCKPADSAAQALFAYTIREISPEGQASLEREPLKEFVFFYFLKGASVVK